MKRVKPLLVAATIAAAFTLAGCAGEADSVDSAPPTSPSGTDETPAQETAPQPSAAPTGPLHERPTIESITCDAMLDPLVDQALRATQLRVFEKPWTQFNFEPTGAAIECPWGYEGQMESTVYFAWSELAGGEDERFIALVTENGYTTKDDEQGTWVVTPGEDAQDSGILVTDEWVAFAPTRDLIPAIVWTR